MLNNFVSHEELSDTLISAESFFMAVKQRSDQKEEKLGIYKGVIWSIEMWVALRTY